MSEEWRDINGYEGLYQVSCRGNIRRLPVVITRTSRGSTFQQRVPGRALRPSITAGYPSVGLCKDGVVKRNYVHALVAEAFIGLRPPRAQVAHENGNPLDPTKGNLRYDTPVGNAADRHKHGTSAKGVNNPAAKFTEEQVREIKVMLKTSTVVEVARRLNHPRQTIGGIASGRNWGYIKTEEAV